MGEENNGENSITTEEFNRRRKQFISKTKRLDTIKKKARELSILCNVDVCLVGTHDDEETDDFPSTWHTWPENQNEVVRIIEKYQNKIEEKDVKVATIIKEEEKDVSRRAIWDFDVDKGLEGMSEEELKRVLETVDSIEADVDRKLALILNKQSSSGKYATPMTEDLPSDQTMEEAYSHKFDFESTHSSLVNTDLALNQTMMQAQPEELDSEVTKKGVKIFGVFMTPAMEA